MPPLGNDVVDLEMEENCGKSGDSRFLSRVFAASEQALIAGAACPDALLWALWAAKEAAYKAASRFDPAVSGSPRHYPVSIDDEQDNGLSEGSGGFRYLSDAGLSRDIPPRRLTGRVFTPLGTLALRVAVTERYCHALAGEDAAALDRVAWRVAEERRGEGGDPSQRIRTALCAAVAERLACPAAEIEIRKDPSGPGVPSLFRRGGKLPFEISLSHDGRFIAYAWRPDC
ncbi:MAG: 4'-phosphopantetheinyl transferase superfamily protein [Syntrophaceae bacterium]|nr:4'-phosphopantetheinyl transferase superfamily protein [Syntrophaceae bacterium]